MKTIKLTKCKEAIVDDRDFEELSKSKWFMCSRYAMTERNGKRILMHRHILQPPDGMFVDHINGNTLDNRRENLRLATKQQNCSNQRKKGGVSRYKGAYKTRGGKWYSKIAPHGKSIYLGTFDTEELAADAYNKAAKHYFGEFANINIIENMHVE